MSRIIKLFEQIREIDDSFEESFEVELDNLDKAKIIYNDGWGIVVENEHGTNFPITDLSEEETIAFEFALLLDLNDKRWPEG